MLTMRYFRGAGTSRAGNPSFRLPRLTLTRSRGKARDGSKASRSSSAAITFVDSAGLFGPLLCRIPSQEEEDEPEMLLLYALCFILHPAILAKTSHRSRASYVSHVMMGGFTGAALIPKMPSKLVVMLSPQCRRRRLSSEGRGVQCSASDKKHFRRLVNQ